MTLRIRSGPADVIAHGTVNTFGGNDLRFELPLPDRLFMLNLHFPLESVASEPRVESRRTDQGYDFILHNFDSAEPRGSGRPVLLEDLGVEALFVHFCVSRHGRTEDRMVHYTFYRVEKNAIGWMPVVADEGGG